MKYYVIAGEPSGDLHAANLIHALKQRDDNAEFRAWGGDKMMAAGATIVKHIRDLAFMGFVEVVANLRTISRNLKLCKDDLAEYQPDVLILVDYPGFNLRIAEYAKKHDLRVFYYISPQVWAWKKNRVKKIRRFVDRMFVILPFEEEFYKQHNVPVFYGGHPVMDEVEQFRNSGDKTVIESDRDVIALLPGSRTQEIKKMLPVMAELAVKYPQYVFIIAGVEHQRELYHPFLEIAENLRIVIGKTYRLLNSSTAAIVTSGTATLETALFGVPQVVCYAGSAISISIARRLIKIPYISLVNLILDKPAVKELIQSQLKIENLQREFEKTLPGTDTRREIVSSYSQLRELLGGAGASERIANEMWSVLSKTNTK
jgi:lipid-A-disaccharide synthase